MDAKQWKMIGFGVLVVGGLVGAVYLPIGEWMKSFLNTIEGYGVLGAVVFVAIYVVCTILLVPGTILTLGAGAVYGWIYGAIVVSIASTIGALCAFLVGRYAARDMVTGMMDKYPRFKAIDQSVGGQGWKIVFLTRLSPVFPFNVLNYLFGVTRVKMLDYLVASWVGMMPGTVMYVYFGSLAGTVAELSTEGDGDKSTLQYVLYVVGGIATIAVTVVVTKIARKSMREYVPEEVEHEAVKSGG